MNRKRLEAWQLKLGAAAILIRECHGWDRDRMARECGFSTINWCLMEGGKLEWSLHSVERVRAATGIDPYMLAHDVYDDLSREPPSIRALREQLRETWKNELNQMRRRRQLLSLQ